MLEKERCPNFNSIISLFYWTNKNSCLKLIHSTDFIAELLKTLQESIEKDIKMSILRHHYCGGYPVR
jgi:hypothetical protein